MIDFELGDELELLRATARDFASDHLRPAQRDHERQRCVGDAARSAYAEIGFATLEWPEVLGGSELGALASCLMLEELAAGDAGAAVALDRVGPAFYALQELGGVEALRELALPIVEGEGGRAVLFWNGEGARGRIEVNDGRARGSVPWVPADEVSLLVVLDERGAFAVQQGIEASELRGAGLRAAGAAELRLEDAPLCGQWNDPAAARRAVARARLSSAALLLGTMRESAEFSRHYALDRVAFGRPIAHHQALAFLIVDMATAVDGTRLLVWDAAWRLDRGEDAVEPCATAFVEACEQSMFVTPNGVQILGGHGFMQDYPVEKLMREARTLGLTWGGVDAAREAAGCELGATDVRVELSAAGA